MPFLPRCFRASSLSACLLPFVGFFSAMAVAQTTIRVREADQFVDSLGIHVHIESTTTPYRNYQEINRKLADLGMRHIRDEINDTNSKFVGEMKQLGKLGYSLCGLIEGGNDYPPLGTRLEPGQVVPMIRNLLPTIDAVEGPNEPDDGGFVYDGVPYPQGAIDESQDLWNIVKGSPEIGHLPVVALSEGTPQNFTQLAQVTPPPIDYATFGNMHAYQGGSIGDQSLGEYSHHSRELTGDDALWTTEMGYHNNVRYLSDGEQQGVSERASAIYLPIAFLSGFDHGVVRTFSYELLDEANDPQLMSGSGEGHYGLLNFDASPKPAFRAMKNLIELFQDQEARFEPGLLTLEFEDAPRTMRCTLLEKSNGDYYLALWNDVPVYQVATAESVGKDLYPRR